MDTKPFSLSVKMLLRDPAGRYLLLKRSPASKNHAGLWELPGGKIDSHEAFDEALIREVREETGLESRIDRVVGTGTSEIAERTVVYLFLEGRAASDQVRLSDEHDDHRWLYPDGLLAMLDEICPQFRAMLEDYCRARGYSKPSPPSTAAAKSWSDTVTELDAWVGRYKDELQSVYQEYATELQRVLTKAVQGICPTALVQARPKGIRNFAEKILRKNKYKDPLAEITDLCGARVVTHIQSEADAICQFIRENFVIDEKNSLDTRSRLGAGEFGYRSVHYIVQFRKDKFPDLSENLYPLKAEIQVRTIPQHAWSDIGHDRIYKSGFSIPAHWQREAARLAALLESADDGFSRLVEGLEAYHCNFGAYLTPDQIVREIQIAEAVLRHDQTNAGLVERLARLAISHDDWDKARQVIEDFRRQWPDRVMPELLCCLGSTLCHLHAAKPASPEYIAGRGHLRLATQMDPGNIEARVRLAETGASAEERLRLFREAFDVSPTDPAALGGYVLHRIVVDRTTAFVPLLRPILEAAIDKCQSQVNVGVNIPWALYRMAAFKLLLGSEHEWDCLRTLCQAVRHTSVAFHLDSAIEAAWAMCEVEPQRRDAKSAERLLRLARRARFPNASISDELCPAGPPISRPVVIVAGGCDPAHQKEMAAYRKLLRDTFADFSGTIISGGTSEGISGLVGELGKDSQGRIHTIGYLPSTLPADGTAHRDERYHELRNTDGRDAFSALEPLQNWIDLVGSGISPHEVRVLGINGGRIAEFEYRLAWALGAQVAVVRDSGRVADKIEGDVQAGESDGLLIVPKDVLTLRAFLCSDSRESLPFSEPQLERLARLAHSKFLEQNRHRHPDRAMRPWEELDEGFRLSNLDQVAYMTRTLQAAGYDVVPGDGTPAEMPFTPEEIDLMARMEHGRWNIERIRSGWHYDKQRNPAKKLSPYLVAWEQLPEDARQWDRDVVQDFPRLLAEAGLRVVRRK